MTKVQLQDAYVAERETGVLLEERISELELELEDTKWMPLEAGQASQEFSSRGLLQLIQLSRIMYLKNPLIHHGVEVMANYVWAKGASFGGADNDVDEIVQGFLNDRNNLAAFSSHSARVGNDKRLSNDGNIFFALFTNTGDGEDEEGLGDDETKAHVTVRIIPAEEIIGGDIIYNPQDADEVWYYKRRYREVTFDEAEGKYSSKAKVAYYPDWRYVLKVQEEELDQPKTIGRGQNGGDVLWNVPVYHVKDGGLPNMRFGVPIFYSAFSWARAVVRDLEDYATIRRALAKWAWRLTTTGRGSVAAAKAKLGTTVTTSAPAERNPPPLAGSTFIQREGMGSLEPIRTAGAAPSPEEGRRLWLLVSAGTGIPETILAGNADAGNLATAETLDRPTELQMENRQTLWSDTFQDIIGYVIATARALVPNKLPTETTVQVYQRNEETGVRELVSEQQPVDDAIVVRMPSVLERNTQSLVQGIIQAATLGASGTRAQTIPDRTISGLLLEALSVDDIPEILDELFPNGAMWLPGNDPNAPKEPADAEDPLAGTPLGDALAEPEVPGEEGAPVAGGGDNPLAGTPLGAALEGPVSESSFRRGLRAFREELARGEHSANGR